YINGENVATKFAMVQPVTDGPGIVSTKAGEGFVGLIDDIRIWDVVREQTAIYDNMKTMLYGDEAGLVAYYRFDDVDSAGRLAIDAYSRFLKHAADSQLAHGGDWLNGWTNAAVLVGDTITVEAVAADDNPFGEDADSNNNHISDRWERKYFGDLLAQGAEFGDTDGDGLNELYEYLASTNPLIKSTDGVNFDSEADFDADGLTNYEEQLRGLHPGNPDSDDDGLGDGRELGKDLPLGTDQVGDFATLIGNPADSRSPVRNDNWGIDLAPGRTVTYTPASSDDDALNMTGSFTVEFWMMASTAGTILEKKTALGGLSQYKLVLNADGTLTFVAGTASIKSLEAITMGTWVHVSAVYAMTGTNTALLSVRWASADETGTRFDEHLTASTTPVAATLPGSMGTDLVLGGASSFTGVLDDLRLWNLARAEDDVIALRDATLLPAVINAAGTQLVLYSSFDDKGVARSVKGTAVLGTGTAENHVETISYMPGFTLPLLERAGVLANGAAWIVVDRKRLEADENENGIPDSWEYQYFGELLAPGAELGDTDEDGLNELYEYLCSTNPLVAKTNGVDYDSDLDLDGDYLVNYDEQLRGLDPRNPDSDDDGYGDYYEIFTLETDPRSSRSPDKKDLFPNGQSMSFPTAAAKVSYSPESMLNDPLAMTGSFTVEFWLKATGTGKVLEKLGKLASQPDYRITIELDKKVMFRVGSDFVKSAETLTLGSWVHVAAVYDVATGELRLRLGLPETDGTVAEKVTAKAIAGTLQASAGTNLVIGNGFTGEMDELRVWTRVRTPDQIIANRDAELDAVAANTETVTTNTGTAQAPVWVTTTSYVHNLALYSTFNDGYAVLVGADNATAGTQTAENFAETISYIDGFLLPNLDRAGVLNGAVFVPCDRQSREVDSNANQIPDWWEYLHFTELLAANAQYGDTDEDGLNELYEFLSGTNPLLVKTDGITNDGEADFDGDGLTNYEEQLRGLNPGNPDSDDDGLCDGRELGRNPALADDQAIDFAALIGNPADSRSPARLANWGMELPAGQSVTYSPASASDDALNMTGSFTVEFWMQATAAGTVLEKKAVLGGLSQYRVSVDASGYLVFVAGTATIKSIEPISMDGNTWVHVAAVYSVSGTNSVAMSLRHAVVDATETRFEEYVTTSTYAISALLPDSAGTSVVLGGTSGFAGVVDDLRVWNVARSEAEIIALRDATLLPAVVNADSTQLVLYSSFDDKGVARTANGVAVLGTGTAENHVATISLMPGFTLPNLERAGVLSAGADWIVVDRVRIEADQNENGIPDSWEYQYFGDLLADGAEFGDVDDDG
ncbi:MAG: LamG domain-containing protein, partial [Lentisphaerae bacterium]|nr:LamG domain-containing protein [Lentisphaerota bacterium]